MPNGVKRALIGTMTALVCYSLLGFLILPGVAQRIANQQLAQYATVPASLERLEFNPFSLELTLFNLRLGEPGAEQLGFERLYLNLQWSSLWRRTLHLADVELDRLQSEVRFDENGTLNLSQLFALPESEEAPEEAETEPFALRVDRLQLTDGALHFEDRRPQEPIDMRLDALSFELLNFATRAEDAADAVLVANGPNGARLEWQGQIGLTPIASTGQLKVSNLDLATFWPYVREAAPLALRNGRLGFSSEYRLDLSEGTALVLENIEAALSPLDIDSLDGEPLLRLEQLQISQTSLDLAKQQIVVGQVRSHKLESWVARERDGELNWQKLFAAQPADTAPTTADQPAAETEATDNGQPWQVLLNDVQLREYQLHLADRVPETEVALELGPLELDLQDFDSLGTSPFQLELATGIGRQGSLQAKGQLQLEPASGTLAVQTRDIDLRIAQAYLSPFIHLELRSGLLSSDLDVDLTSSEPLAFEVNGAAEITQLHTLDTIKNRDLLKWQRLQLEGLKYNHPERLTIGSIALQQPYARFIINPDLSTNVNDLLIDQPQGQSTSQPPEASETSEPLAIRIGGIKIDDGSANFADLSLTPPFITAVQELNGAIGTLDNQQQAAASVDIKGKVDRYAPVSIVGSLTPFDPMQSLDIATRFKQVELTTLSPYSSKFAGYRIRKGRLDLDLHYRIQQGQLNAENKVVLEQLQLGEKVDSPDAVDLPVRLAVALLKDTKGTISIELPVQGNLDDPQFSVMPIVWQTLRNLVLRAAQAPFKFIGGLVGGSQEDLSQVAFRPGTSELDAPARSALDTLVAALGERPALRLEVEGMSAPRMDGPLLAEQRLEQEYQSTWYSILQRRGDKVPASARELVVPEDDKAVLLEGIYRSRLKRQPPAEWRELEDEERAARMRSAMIEHWSDNSSLLRRLAQQRASSIKDYLVEQGLADQRVYLLDTGTTEAEDNRVSTVLHLGAE
ncbi:DUF748 domain-containing protein [Stutzerimonas nitrititolerans]|uniref:DUF748 domain-containing protein n=1 Tax=Stutzerimonas nitrititolerans TaxID=2482751 RepID=UPI0028A04E7C|nr:DUF748 domain-containing protein [Stutzerimonas nitrititolerans]